MLSERPQGSLSPTPFPKLFSNRHSNRITHSLNKNKQWQSSKLGHSLAMSTSFLVPFFYFESLLQQTFWPLLNNFPNLCPTLALGSYPGPIQHFVIMSQWYAHSSPCIPLVIVLKSNKKFKRRESNSYNCVENLETSS